MLGVRHQTRTNENEATSKAPNLGRIGKVTPSPAPISPIGPKKRGLVDVTNRGKGISDNTSSKWPQALKGSVSSPVQKLHGFSEAVKVYSEALDDEPESPAGRLGDEEDALVETKLRQTDLGLSNRVRVMKGNVQYFLFPENDTSRKRFKSLDTPITRTKKLRDLSE